MRIIDVRGSDGCLVILGNGVTLPISTTNTSLPDGTIRFNPETKNLEICVKGNWQLTSNISLKDVIDGVVEQTGNKFAGYGALGIKDQPALLEDIISAIADDGVFITPSALQDYVGSKNYLTENQNFTLEGDIEGTGSTKVQTKLKNISSNTILANINSELDQPKETKLTELLDNVFGNNPGSILYRDDNEWKVLEQGKDGQYLKSGNGKPEWVNEKRLSKTDVEKALGYTPLEKITSQYVVDTIGYTPLSESATGLTVGFSGTIFNFPLHAGQILLRNIMAFPVTLPKNLPGSNIICFSPPLDDLTLTIFKNSVLIGNLKFKKNSTKESIEFIHDVEFKTGDILEIVSPNPADQRFGNLTFTLVGFR